jgi:iron complex outermembrane receptor protein
MTDWEVNGGLSWYNSAVSTTNYNNLFDGDFDRSFSAVSGSAGLSYLPNDKTNLSLNVSSGFRAPNVNELASKGFKPEDMRNEFGDKDLEAERVMGVDLSFNQSYGGSRYFASVFLQNYSNFIYLEQDTTISSPNGRPNFDFVQNDVQFYGFEIGWGIVKNWESSSTAFDISFSTTKNNLESENYIIYNLPADKLVLNLSHNFSDWGGLKQPELLIQFVQYLNIWDDGRLMANGNGKWFHVLNANVESEVSALGNDLTIGLSGKNLLNSVYVAPLSRLAVYGVPNPGISINAYIKYPFDL